MLLKFALALLVANAATAAPLEKICGYDAQNVVLGQFNNCWKLGHIPIALPPAAQFPCFTGFTTDTPPVGMNDDTNCSIEVADKGTMYTRYKFIDYGNKRTLMLIFRRT